MKFSNSGNNSSGQKHDPTRQRENSASMMHQINRTKVLNHVVDTDHEGGLLLGVGHHPAGVHGVKRHLDGEEKSHSDPKYDGTRTDGSHIWFIIDSICNKDKSKRAFYPIPDFIFYVN